MISVAFHTITKTFVSNLFNFINRCRILLQQLVVHICYLSWKRIVKRFYYWSVCIHF